MATTTGVGSVSSYDPSFRPRQASSELDPEAFMQLLVAQLRYQDPLKGTDQQQFMQQLATLSSMQQQTELNKQLGSMLDRDASMRAMALIGYTVAGTANSQSVSGVVDSVTIAKGEPILNLGSVQLALDEVTQVSFK